MRLIFGTSDIYDADSSREENNTNSLDCTIKGDYTYSFGTETAGDDGGTLVTSLKDEKNADHQFTQEDDELDTGEKGYLDPAVYGSDDADECDLYSFDVVPNGGGEVNHGTVVSTFVRLIKQHGFRGAGCLVKFASHSQWGKVDPTDEFQPDADGGTITLDSFAAACNLAKKDGSHRDDKPNKPDQAKGPAWKTAGGDHPSGKDK